jgi:hypothetical protein
VSDSAATYLSLRRPVGDLRVYSRTVDGNTVYAAALQTHHPVLYVVCYDDPFDSVHMSKCALCERRGSSKKEGSPHRQSVSSSSSSSNMDQNSNMAISRRRRLSLSFFLSMFSPVLLLLLLLACYCSSTSFSIYVIEETIIAEWGEMEVVVADAS